MSYIIIKLCWSSCKMAVILVR